jgi:hypothetical protein
MSVTIKCKKRESRVKGKGLLEPCLICKERRITEEAHFPSLKSKGGKETILLCPTHYRLLDFGRLSKSEFEIIWQTRYANQFNSVEDFVEWAYENCYNYNLSDLKRKFWTYNPKTE